MELFRLFGRIFIDDKQAKKGLKDTQNEVKKTSKGFTGLGSLLGKLAIGGTILKIGSDSIRAGSDIEELSNKFNVVFGDMKDEVDDWSQVYGRAINRSKFQIQGFLADQQDILTGLGLNTEASAELSQGIVKLGFDLASFQNLSDDEAQQRLASALRGSSEAAAGFGADLSVATLKQTDYFKSLNKNFNELSQLEKIQLRYNVILSQSGNALDDASETAGGFANSVKGLQAAWFDLTVEIGQAAIPKLTEVVQFVTGNVIPSIREFGESLFNLENEKLSSLAASISNFTTVVLADLFAKLGDFISRISPELLETLTKLASAWSKIINLTIKLYETLQPLFDFIASVGVDAFKSFNDEIQETLDSLNTLLDFIDNVFSQKWEDAWDDITGDFTLTWDNAFDRIVQGAKNAFRQVSGLGPIFGRLVTEAGSSAIGSLGKNQGLATGGEISEGGMFRVGEKGPENVFLPAGSAVTPNAANGMMKGNKIEVNINNPVMTDERFIDQIGEQLVGVLKTRGVVVQGG